MREILIILNKRRDFSNNVSIPIVIPVLSLSLAKEARIDKKDTTIIYKKIHNNFNYNLSYLYYKINFLGINIRIFNNG
jgi:hypothetical protein